jgi:hypothetical protein
VVANNSRKSAPTSEGHASAFIDKWVYDIGHMLWYQLEALKDLLDSEDKHTREHAAKEIHDILGWLYEPPGPLYPEERLRRTRDTSNDESMSVQDRLAAVRRVARSSGRPRGRPRTETAQHAIRALYLHLATPLSWREIALTVKGCNHRRPNPAQRSCVACGDAIRDAVGRFERFLRDKGYHPEFPRRVELDRMSPTDLKRLFGTTPTDSDE